MVTGRVVFEDFIALHRAPLSLCSMEVNICLPVEMVQIKGRCADSDTSNHAFFLVMGSRLIRYIPYLLANPLHLWLVPFFLIHLYAHTLLKIYALFTLTNVSDCNLCLGSIYDIPELNSI